MKPTFEALRTACQEVDPEVLREHLARLSDRYFTYFPDPAIHEHVRRLARISPEHPAEVIVEMKPANGVECTVLAFDHPGVFSLITGVMTGMGLDILSGEVFTYARPDVRRRRRGPDDGRTRPLVRRGHARRKIVNHFSGRLDRSPSLSGWIEDLSGNLQTILALLEKGDDLSRERARNRVNEMVVRRLARLRRDPREALHPVSLEVDNSGPETTRLKIVSQDTPAFLYALTHAFSLHDIRIEHVRIHTFQNRIEDEIHVVDRDHRKIEDPETLSRVKLSVLLTKRFTYFLTRAPDPYAALCRFRHLVEDILHLPGRDEWIRSLSDPNTLKDLAVLLGTSDFLWEDFIRLQYETLLSALKPPEKIRPLGGDPETLVRRIRKAIDGAASLEDLRERLNRFKDQEIFSIDLDRILQRDTGLDALSERLTGLAEAVLNTAAGVAYTHLAERFGRPMTEEGLETPYALLGLGKLGGRALGYASDVEFLLVYSDDGVTDGQRKIPNWEFFNHLVAMIAGLIRAKRQGIFHVDLRLRPHGSAGPLASSLKTFCDYYGVDGPAHSFERLALVRLRAVGGDPLLGARLERIRDEILYASRSIRTDELRALREKQLREKTVAGTRNAKFSPGGLVDLEYHVQILQLLHGGRLPKARTPLIQQALAALGDAKVLTADETSQMFAAHDFLRSLINALRILRGSATDLSLPHDDTPEFGHLAGRMGYRKGKPLGPAQQLRVDYETHTAAVRAFAERHFGPDAIPGTCVGTVADPTLSNQVSEE